MVDMLQHNIKLFLTILKECPEITYVGQEVLRSRASEVPLGEGVIIAKALQATLLRFREITGLGRGLAAPQIGIGKRVFVTFMNGEFQTFINPKLVRASKDMNFLRESCISSTLLWADVKRSKSIVLSWTNEDGDLKTEEFGDFPARLLQHEYDHLEGRVNLDVCEKASIEFVKSSPREEKLREA
jgi:peptide deformylase